MPQFDAGQMHDPFLASERRTEQRAERERLLAEYFATEWGVPRTDEAEVFETLSLCGFQAGLSWASVLLRRPDLREAFDGFDPGRIARYTDDDRVRLLAHPGMIRNRRKIDAVMTNARATVRLHEAGTTLSEFVWAHRPERTVMPLTWADIPRSTPESTALAAELRNRGFVFVGPTILFATMATLGVVDAWPLGSAARGSSGLWGPDGSRLDRVPRPRLVG